MEARLIRLTLLIAILCVSCARLNPWDYHEIERLHTGCKTALLEYSPDNKFSGIELQFLKGDFGVITYLNVYCRTILPSDLDPNSSNVFITIDDEDFYFLAHRMEGGQRLLLPCEAQELLLTTFQAGKNVIIKLDGYCQTYDATCFCRLYKEFLKDEDRIF